MPLILFLLAKAALAYLQTALSAAMRPLSPFWQAQYVQAFPLKPALFCNLFTGLGSTIKSAISHFFSSSLNFAVLVILSVFPFTSISLADLTGTVFLLLLFYLTTMGPWTLVFPGKRRADELARQGALVVSSAIPCTLSPLIFCIHSSLFSDWRSTISSKFFDTQFPSISTEELVLPRHARCVLSRLRCNGHSLLLSSYFSRIGRGSRIGQNLELR